VGNAGILPAVRGILLRTFHSTLVTNGNNFTFNTARGRPAKCRRCELDARGPQFVLISVH